MIIFIDSNKNLKKKTKKKRKFKKYLSPHYSVDQTRAFNGSAFDNFITRGSALYTRPMTLGRRAGFETGEPMNATLVPIPSNRGVVLMRPIPHTLKEQPVPFQTVVATVTDVNGGRCVSTLSAKLVKTGPGSKSSKLFTLSQHLINNKHTPTAQQ